MNKVVLIGRLTKDAELRFTPGTGNGVTTITVATDKYNSKTKEHEADFIGVTIWGKTAEGLSPYLLKGTQVAISGRIQTRSYDAKDGTKKYVTEVVADAFGGVELLGSKGSNNNSNNEYSAPQNDTFAGGNFKEDLQRVDSDSDMPFK